MHSFGEHVDFVTGLDDGDLAAIVGGLDAKDFYEPGVRDTINFALSDITDGVAQEGEPASTTDPVIVYERVRAVMADAGYLLPSSSALLSLFNEFETEGDEVFPLATERTLAPNEPEVAPCYLYFAFAKDDFTGLYDVLAEVVTESELEEILHGEDAETV